MGLAANGAVRPTRASSETGKGNNSNGQKSQIEENLRNLYSDLFEDEVPARFQDLLERLREQEGSRK